jgi:beta-glucosidase/6-phospho-beta-glucosidase/beta-galactosidase
MSTHASDSSPFALPAGFRFGVATAGFQVEGGYNGPGEPANNWSWWEAEGKVDPSGIALDFWNQFDRHLDRAVAAGCDGFRMSIEWARCQPRDGEVDEVAMDRYCAILDAIHDRGMQPLVSLHHFTHPAWLGVDFWLRPEAPERFAQWVALAADRFSGRCGHWVTLNEPNVWSVQSYLTGAFPPGHLLNVGETVRSLDALLTAHVKAYEIIHARQSQAVVATNTFALSIYELDRMLVDILLARSRGVKRADLGAWLAERKAQFVSSLGPISAGLAERALRRWAARAVPLDRAFPRTVDAVYDSPCERTLDVSQVDFYDPIAGHHVQLPGTRTAGGRVWEPARPLWDDPPSPSLFRQWLASTAELGLEVWVVENGLCNRVRRGVAYPRADGWDRPRYLKAHLAQLVDTVDSGLPVTGYYHWTLADNYEWGSYEPRFGLYGVDRERGIRWSDHDSMGGDAVATYRRLIDGLRAGDRSVVR